MTEEVSDNDSELENRFRTECAIGTTVMDPNLRWRLDYLTARRHDDIPCNDSGYSTKMFSNSQGPSPSLSSKYNYYKITLVTFIIIRITYINIINLLNYMFFFDETLNSNIKIIKEGTIFTL